MPERNVFVVLLGEAWSDLSARRGIAGSEYVASSALRLPKSGIMKSSLLSSLAVSAAVAVTAYTQVQWRSDRAVFRALKENFTRLEAQTRFLATGDRVTDQVLLLEGREGSTNLAAQVHGRRRVVYIGQRGCPFCDWFAEEMARRDPHWKDSVLVVSIGAPSDSLRNAFRVAEASVNDAPGTPILLVVDSAGLVRSAGLGAKRVLNILQLEGIASPTFDEMVRDAKRQSENR